MTSEHDLPPGYEFVRILGAGGFGEVVLARQVAIDRLVAIKQILGSALSDEQNVARFRREAQVLATTNSRCVVRIYDFRELPTGAQLVMEYVPGVTLGDLIAQGPVPAGQALPILRDVATALAEMASRGVVHRDVKPGNVFVLPDGRAKLGDFGLARALVDPTAFRTIGPALGTPAYFPPEISRDAAEPDERSDAYSFAVMAYETLTGERPFSGADVISSITAHWNDPPRSATELLADFPAEAEAALGAGLTKVPEGRMLPLDVVARLESVRRWPELPLRNLAASAARRNDPTAVRPDLDPTRIPTTTVALPSRKKRPFKLVLVVASVLALVAVGAILVTRDRDGKPPAALAINQVAVTTEPAAGKAPCPAGDLTFHATLTTNGAAGTIRLHWTQPDKKQTETRSIAVLAGQKAVLSDFSFHVEPGQRLTGNAVVHVDAPGSRRASARGIWSCAKS